MSTILDVEKESGVSKSTISRFLHGRSVNEENRIKIEEAIKKLNYKMNPIASGLKSSKTFSVGALLPDITDSFFPPIIKEFERCMSENGYNVILSDYGNNPDKERKQLEVLSDKKLDGFVIATSNTISEHIQQCLDDNLPIILLDRLLPDLECDSITVDNFNATYNAISECIKMGHTNFGAVYGHYFTDVERLRGFQKAIKDNGLKADPEKIIKVHLADDSPEEAFAKLLDMKDAPSLIFCSNIYMGIGALKVRLQRNLNIPEDVSVLVFDDIATFPNHDYISYIKPEFANISQPLTEIGKYAAELLLERIKNPDRKYEAVNIELKTRFNMTGSIAKLNNP
ncbi:MAG: LacI family DNA-binding transcriptional regulator [Spirochaetales bacterium]|uniref:LacI family DNA-binding transcriptional regulator n=1 Tax=Candidatus Thalassospirochaeta sargassi TaxID=3119039 RepID=A0AAJ1MMX6_9SPIO|nr:LacI family DNA-binding transcriptional regulator [Spirochaetales bacterium]